MTFVIIFLKGGFFMTENFEISRMARTNISQAMKSLRNTAERLKEPELDLALNVLEKELDNIPESFSVSIEIKGTGIAPNWHYSIH